MANRRERRTHKCNFVFRCIKFNFVGENLLALRDYTKILFTFYFAQFPMAINRNGLSHFLAFRRFVTSAKQYNAIRATSNAHKRQREYKRLLISKLFVYRTCMNLETLCVCVCVCVFNAERYVKR